MKTSPNQRATIIKGLLERIDKEANNDPDERVKHLVRILNNHLEKFVNEDAIDQFYTNLAQLEE